jgi:hypothetical protein
VYIGFHLLPGATPILERGPGCRICNARALDFRASLVLHAGPAFVRRIGRNALALIRLAGGIASSLFPFAWVTRLHHFRHVHRFWSAGTVYRHPHERHQAFILENETRKQTVLGRKNRPASGSDLHDASLQKEACSFEESGYAVVNVLCRK